MPRASPAKYNTTTHPTICGFINTPIKNRDFKIKEPSGSASARDVSYFHRLAQIHNGLLTRMYHKQNPPLCKNLISHVLCFLYVNITKTTDIIYRLLFFFKYSIFRTSREESMRLLFTKKYGRK